MNRRFPLMPLVTGLVTLLGCNSERVDSSPSASRRIVATVSAAATGDVPGPANAQTVASRESVFGDLREVPIESFPPGPVFERAVPRPRTADYPGHFRNKAGNAAPKPGAPPPPPPVGPPPPPVSAEAIVKQREYVDKLQALQTQLRALPQEEQQQRQVALKRSVLGE